MRTSVKTLKSYVSLLLIEGRVDDAREAFPDMDEDVFNDIVANQPTGSNNKYLPWSCTQVDALMQDDPDTQAVQVVIQAVRLFDGNSQRLKQRDINQYKNVDEVEKAVAELGKSKGEKAREVRSDTDTIYQDDRFLVLRPHTTESSCKYGVGTKWCIAATGSTNYFNSYSTGNNKFYFVIDKKATQSSPESKFALAIIAAGAGAGGRQIQVYNASDKLVSIETVAKHVGDKWPEIWQLIQGHVKKNPSTREVEDARKATEEHVKDLLSGKTITEEAARKIARDAKLTLPVVKALLKRYDGLGGPGSWSDPRYTFIVDITPRVHETQQDAALMIIKFAIGLSGGDRNHGSSDYYVKRMIAETNLSAAGFYELANSKNETALSSIMMNPNAPDDLKEKIASEVKGFKDNEAKSAVYKALMKSGSITNEQFKDAMTTKNSVYDVLNSEGLKLTPEMMRMVPITTAYDFKRFLKLPNIPTDYVSELVNKLQKSLKGYELYDIFKTAPIDHKTIDSLWKDKDQGVRTALLQNPAIGAENASKFALSKNSAYRFAVAHNVATSADDLDLLGTDESVSTRAAVGANPKTRQEMLAALARDEAIAVRTAVAGNAMASRGTLDALKKDSDDMVRKIARKTLKSTETTESHEGMMSGMMSLLKEQIEDDSMQDTMTPSWRQLPTRSTTNSEFVAVFLLQNNGHAKNEEVDVAFQRWNPERARNHNRPGSYKSVWSLLKSEERHGDSPTRTTSAAGRGWWWAPAGLNKGALVSLTPAGAGAAMDKLTQLRKTSNNWNTELATPVRKSPPAQAVAQKKDRTDVTLEPSTSRGPKTLYKIYGKMKGSPAHTRLKGKAFVAPANTEFKPGEQASVSPEGDKLKVKKADGDHTQTWEPSED